MSNTPKTQSTADPTPAVLAHKERQSEMSIFVILHPGSNSNPSDKYRVVASSDLMRFMNSEAIAYDFTEFADYPSAEIARDTANKGQAPVTKKIGHMIEKVESEGLGLTVDQVRTVTERVYEQLANPTPVAGEILVRGDKPGDDGRADPTEH